MLRTRDTGNESVWETKCKQTASLCGEFFINKGSLTYLGCSYAKLDSASVFLTNLVFGNCQMAYRALMPTLRRNGKNGDVLYAWLELCKTVADRSLH